MKIYLKMFFLIFLLAGCNSAKKSEFNKVVVYFSDQSDKIFHNYNVYKISQVVTTNYVTVIYYFNELDLKERVTIEKIIINRGWHYMGAKNNSSLFCDSKDNILEIMPPSFNYSENKDGIIVAQSEEKWVVGFSFNIDGNDECKSSFWKK